MMPVIRPYDERNATRKYSISELNMISGQIAQLQNMLTDAPFFQIVLNNMFIADADRLMNGVPN